MDCHYCGRPADDARACSALCEKQLGKIDGRAWTNLVAGWVSAGPVDSTRLGALIVEAFPDPTERARFRAWLSARNARRKTPGRNSRIRA